MHKGGGGGGDRESKEASQTKSIFLASHPLGTLSSLSFSTSIQFSPDSNSVINNCIKNKRKQRAANGVNPEGCERCKPREPWRRRTIGCT